MFLRNTDVGAVFRFFVFLRASMDDSEKVQVGGQAVIEGVMMRSPEFVTVAVRKPDGNILLKKDRYTSWTKRFKVLGFPIIRGGVILIESMVLGIKALNFSGDVAITEEEKKKDPDKVPDKRSKLWTAGAVVLALGLGIGLFFFLPLLLTELMGVKSGLLFNLIDGIIRLIFFLVYLALISLWKEIRRIFEYHGAEHKSIFAYEEGKPLTVEGIRSFTTRHPRCGTSFLIVVMLVALVVFILLGKPQNWGDRFIRFLFIPVIGGISYEIIRLSGKKFGKKLAKVLVSPGLWLQKITTKEPDNSQLEVALVALNGALDRDVGADVEMFSG